jgi:hypothetical protein
MKCQRNREMTFENRKNAKEVSPTKPHAIYAGHKIYHGVRLPEFRSSRFEQWLVWLDKLIDEPNGEEKLAQMLKAYSGYKPSTWDKFMQEKMFDVIKKYKERRGSLDFSWNDLVPLFQFYYLESKLPHLWTLSRVYGVEDEWTRDLLIKSFEGIQSIPAFTQKIQNLYYIEYAFGSKERAIFLSKFKEDLERQALFMSFDGNFVPEQGIAPGYETGQDLFLRYGG